MQNLLTQRNFQPLATNTLLVSGMKNVAQGPFNKPASNMYVQQMGNGLVQGYATHWENQIRNANVADKINYLGHTFKEKAISIWVDVFTVAQNLQHNFQRGYNNVHIRMLSTFNQIDSPLEDRRWVGPIHFKFDLKEGPQKSVPRQAGPFAVKIPNHFRWKVIKPTSDNSEMLWDDEHSYQWVDNEPYTVIHKDETITMPDGSKQFPAYILCRFSGTAAQRARQLVPKPVIVYDKLERDRVDQSLFLSKEHLAASLYSDYGLTVTDTEIKSEDAISWSQLIRDSGTNMKNSFDMLYKLFAMRDQSIFSNLSDKTATERNIKFFGSRGTLTTGRVQGGLVGGNAEQPDQEGNKTASGKKTKTYIGKGASDNLAAKLSAKGVSVSGEDISKAITSLSIKQNIAKNSQKALTNKIAQVESSLQKLPNIKAQVSRSLKVKKLTTEKNVLITSFLQNYVKNDNKTYTFKFCNGSADKPTGYLDLTTKWKPNHRFKAGARIGGVEQPIVFDMKQFAYNKTEDAFIADLFYDAEQLQAMSSSDMQDSLIAYKKDLALFVPKNLATAVTEKPGEDTKFFMTNYYALNITSNDPKLKYELYDNFIFFFYEDDGTITTKEMLVDTHIAPVPRYYYMKKTIGQYKELDQKAAMRKRNDGKKYAEFMKEGSHCMEAFKKLPEKDSVIGLALQETEDYTKRNCPFNLLYCPEVRLMPSIPRTELALDVTYKVCVSSHPYSAGKDGSNGENYLKAWREAGVAANKLKMTSQKLYTKRMRNAIETPKSNQDLISQLSKKAHM